MKKEICYILFNIALNLYCCKTEETYDVVTFDYYGWKGDLDSMYSIQCNVNKINDSINLIRWQSKDNGVHIKVNSNGVYQLINSDSSYTISNSFSDTIFHQSYLSPFYEIGKSRLMKQRTFQVSGGTMPVYLYYEENDKGNIAYATYYSPKIGFLIFYNLDSGSAYIKRFEKDIVSKELISSITSDSTFYAGLIMRNPTVLTVKELPPEH